MNAITEQVAAAIHGAALSAWKPITALSRRQLEDLKHEAGRLKVDGAEWQQRAAAQIVEAVCELETEARKQKKESKT